MLPITGRDGGGESTGRSDRGAGGVHLENQANPLLMPCIWEVREPQLLPDSVSLSARPELGVETEVTPEEFLRLYERKASSRHFEDVSPLIADDAVFWFNDGSYVGKESIRKAFENTWALEIRDERYWLDNISWLANEERFAVCTYLYHWTGVVKDKFRELGSGRGR